MQRCTKWAAALFAVVACSVLSVAAHAEAFGRFGFIQQLDLAGMRVDREALIAKTPHAYPIAFASPSKIWKATDTTEVGQTVVLSDGPGNPKKVAANLYAPGAGLYYDGPCVLHLKTADSPFLTWPEGSVANDVPTPKINWVLVSTSGLSAPLLLSLPPDEKASFQLSGKAGDWTLTVDGSVGGWVHASFPFGVREFETKTAGDLGQLAIKFDRLKDFYLAPSPHLESLDIVPDEDGLTATWTFSGTFVVPAAVALAPLGGYGLKLRSGYNGTGYQTEAGPILRSIGNKLKIRFPCRHIWPGRAVTLEGPPRPLPGTVSAIDAPSIVDLALEGLRGDRDPQTQPLAEGAIQDYLSSADFAMEVWTRETVSYTSANRGLDLTAAYGLLQQALNSNHVNSPENPFLTSVFWRTDWLTWAPFGEQSNQDGDRRAACLAVVASALHSDPAVRLQGALLEAGLAAQRGWLEMRRRSGEAVPPTKFLEALYPLRHVICGTSIPGVPASAGAQMVLSGVRVLSPGPILAHVDAKGPFLSFEVDSAKPLRLLLMVPDGTELLADDNVASAVRQAGPDKTFTLIVTPKGAGLCRIRLSALTGGAPQTPDLPGYAEAKL